MKNFVVYNSSAGSGKTFTLVKEYLKLVLSTDEAMYFRHILAVTFTNKAASEMKERVLLALSEIAHDKVLDGTSKFLLAALVESKENGGLGVSEKVVITRTKRVLKNVLHNYSFFGISTIDKFTLRLIKTFAKDLDIPLSFDVSLDEMELLQSSVDMLIDKIGRDEMLTEVLLKYVYSQMDRDVNWQIEDNLFKTAQKLLDDDAQSHIASLSKIELKDVPVIHESVSKEINTIEKNIWSIAKSTLNKIDEIGIDSSTFFRGNFPSFLKKLEHKPFFIASDTLQKMLGGTQSWYAKSKPKDQQILVEDNIDYFTEQLLKIIDIQDEKRNEYHLNILLRDNLYGFSLMGHLAKMNQEVKKEQNVLSFSDFNNRISKVIDSEPLPFIYERLGEQYNHYLIDEFQDTSIRQWKNLLPLVDNSLSKGHFNLLVGDAKQAIYRFRGGEVDQIIKLPELLGERNEITLEREAALIRNFDEQVLDNNFRSKMEIVDFNNQFFRHLSKWLPDKYKVMYESLDQKHIDSNDGGGVRLTFYDKSNQETFLEVSNNRVLELVNDYRNVFPLNKIAILTRTNLEGRQLADFLLENNISVISPDSLLVSKSTKVQFVVEILKYLVFPLSVENQFILIEFLSNIKSRSVEDTHDYLQVHGVDFNKYSNSLDVDFDKGQLIGLPLYELVSQIIIVFELELTCDIYIQFLLDIVHLYVQKNDNTISGFLEWWETKGNTLSVAVPSDADAVQIMSIHKSKGLEFEVVILPFEKKGVKIKAGMFDWVGGIEQNGINTAILPYNNTLKETVHKGVVEGELEKIFLDAINLLYVGLTRPKSYMEIISQWSPIKDVANDVSQFYTDFCLDKEDFREEFEGRSEYWIGKSFNNNGGAEQPLEKKGFVIDQIIRGSWRDVIQISCQSPNVWDVCEPKLIGELGVKMHAILADIKSVDDVEFAVVKAVKDGLIDNKDEILKLIKEVISIPEIAPYYVKDSEVYNEQRVLLPGGEVYIPDRVVYHEDKVVIIDYKTGLMQKKHETQVKNYSDIYKNITHKSVVAYLVYFDLMQAIRVG